LETYNYKQAFKGIVARAMKKSSYWEIPAKKYIELYEKVIKMNNGNGKNKK
jgi:glycogen synthase